MANLHQQLEKVAIRNLDTHQDLVAYYNPKEINLDRSVPWTEHNVNQGNTGILEFTHSPPLTLSCELFCDLYEARGNVDTHFVNPLLELTTTRLISPGNQRPPICLFMWGKNFRRFKCVVTSLAIKYTMFLPDGTPCRATASLKMKHAELIASKDGSGRRVVYGNDGMVGTLAQAKRGDPSGGTRGAASRTTR